MDQLIGKKLDGRYLLEELVGDIWDEHEEITYAVIPLGEHTSAWLR